MEEQLQGQSGQGHRVNTVRQVNCTVSLTLQLDIFGIQSLLKLLKHSVLFLKCFIRRSACAEKQSCMHLHTGGASSRGLS